MDNSMKNNFDIKLIFLWLIGIAAMSAQQIEGLGVVYGISVLLWLADFIYLTLTVKTKRQLLLTGVCFWVGSVIRVFGFSGSFAIDVIVMTVYSILFFGGLILYRYIAKKWNNLLATLIVPALWIALFLIFSAIRIPSILRFDILLFDCKLIVQSLSYISVIGLNVVIVLVSAIIAQGVANRRFINVVIALVLIAGMAVSGGIQILKQPELLDTVKIGYSTGAYTGDFINYKAIPYEECVASFNKVFDDAVKQKVDMLAFCEDTYEIQDIKEKEFTEIICDSAKENNIYIVIGFDVKDTDNSEGGKAKNKIVLVGNDGKVICEYSKYNVIPILEADYAPGNGVIPTPVIDINGTPIKAAIAICYDSNFPYYIKQISDDTQLLILPSWDWDGVTYMHSRICGNIAIENRVSLLKPTYDGYTIAVDPYGKVLDFKSTKDTGYENVQVIEIPIYKK